MVSGLKAFAALPKDPGSFPSTHTAAHNCLQLLSQRIRCHCLFSKGTHTAHGAQMYRQKQLKNKNKAFESYKTLLWPLTPNYNFSLVCSLIVFVNTVVKNNHSLRGSCAGDGTQDLEPRILCTQAINIFDLYPYSLTCIPSCVWGPSLNSPVNPTNSQADFSAPAILSITNTISSITT